VTKTSVSRAPQRAAPRSSAPQVVKTPPEGEEMVDSSLEMPATAYEVAAQTSVPLSPSQVLSLQHSVGNQAVGHLLQRSSPESQTAQGVKELDRPVSGFGQPVFSSPAVQLSPKKKKKKTAEEDKGKTETKTGTTTAKKTDQLDDDSQVQHTDKGEAYCCDVGKGLRSPTEAKQDYDAKAAPHPKKMNIEVTGIRPDGSKGPKNYIKCELADDIEDNLREMLKDASADGAELNAKIGLRSLEGQWRVWHNNGHPAGHAYVANPGTSNHGTGRAIDFNAGFEWLLENAGRHGWVNLTTERWHYDHVSTPGIIEHHRKMINNDTLRKQKMGGAKKHLTENEKVALTKQYDEAMAKYVALPYNEKRAYSREQWLKVQEVTGMPEKERTGMLDEATCRAVILWQRSKGKNDDGKVGPATLKAMGIEGGGTAAAEKTTDTSATPTAEKTSVKGTTAPAPKSVKTNKTPKTDTNIQSVANKTEEKAIKAGWSGTVDKSINAGLTIQGKGVRRIPLEALSTVAATYPEDTSLENKKKYTLGRAVVLVPANVNGIDPIEVLVHLHGMTMGYRTAVEKTTFGASVGNTEDLENDKIVQQLEGSGRRMIAALPQGTDQAEFNPKSGEFDSEAFIQEVLPQVAHILKWPAPPTITRTVLSGFSGGGLTINRMRGKQGQPKAPEKLGELILFDAMHGKKGLPGDEVSVWTFLESMLNADLAALSGKSEEAQLKYIREKGFRFRGITTGKSGYGKRYQYLADKLYSKGGKKKEPGWFPTHAAELGGKGSSVYKALAENYQVIFSSNTWHGTLMGDTKEAGVKGYLEQALSAGPPQ
jgi:LAS superfamily LD-carboxypeptidase LdcB